MILVALGFCVAALGTLIGVGGGFILVPTLLMLYPDQPNVWVVAVSMWFIAFNATSGSITYFLRGRVHWRAALVFILAALPGTVIGVWVSHLVSRGLFESIFGGVLATYAVFLFLKKTSRGGATELHAQSQLPRALYLKGAAISLGVGFLASFLGIGGGVIHVPLLVHSLSFPVHLATGTSHLILAATAIFTTGMHLLNGDLDLARPELWMLGLSALAGAQVGAALSGRVSGILILRLLSVALFVVGLRLALAGFHHLG